MTGKEIYWLPREEIDKQIIRFLEKDAMLCLPMVAHKAYVGIIAMDIDKDHISHIRGQAKLLTMFANQAALALAADHLRQSETNRLKHTLKKIEAPRSKLRGIFDRRVAASKMLTVASPESTLRNRSYQPRSSGRPSRRYRPRLFSLGFFS